MIVTDLGELRYVTIDLRRPWPPGAGDVYVGIRYRQFVRLCRCRSGPRVR